MSLPHISASPLMRSCRHKNFQPGGCCPLVRSWSFQSWPKPLPYPVFLLPDSEIVNSPCGRNFNIEEFVNTANGRLSAYTQKVDSQKLTGAEVVKLVAENTSVNPHFLLAFIEFRSKWVLSYPTASDLTYPLGMDTPNNQGLLMNSH